MLIEVSLGGLEFPGCAVRTGCGPCPYRAHTSMNVSAEEMYKHPLDRKATWVCWSLARHLTEGPTTECERLCSV